MAIEGAVGLYLQRESVCELTTRHGNCCKATSSLIVADS